MQIIYHAAAEAELASLPYQEWRAMLNVLEKLEQLGVALPFPHCSAVRQVALWELRPRRGRSPWRAFYKRVGDRMVVGAVGPEFRHDPSGFSRAVGLALKRIGQFEEEFQS